MSVPTVKISQLFPSIELRMSDHPEDLNCYLCLMDEEAVHTAALVHLDVIDELIARLVAAREYLTERRGDIASPGTDDLVFGGERWKVDKIGEPTIN